MGLKAVTKCLAFLLKYISLNQRKFSFQVKPIANHCYLFVDDKDISLSNYNAFNKIDTDQINWNK